MNYPKSKPSVLLICAALITILTGCNGSSSSNTESLREYTEKTQNLKITSVAAKESGATLYVDHTFDFIVGIHSDETANVIPVTFTATPADGSGEEEEIAYGHIDQINPGENLYDVSVYVEDIVFTGSTENYTIHAHIDRDEQIEEVNEEDNHSALLDAAPLVLPVMREAQDTQRIALHHLSLARDALIVGEDHEQESPSEVHGSITLASYGEAGSGITLSSCLLVAADDCRELVLSADGTAYTSTIGFPTVPEDDPTTYEFDIEVPEALNAYLTSILPETGEQLPIRFTISHQNGSIFDQTITEEYPVGVIARTHGVNVAEHVSTFELEQVQQAVFRDFCEGAECEQEVNTRSWSGIIAAILNQPKDSDGYVPADTVIHEGGIRNYHYSVPELSVSPSLGGSLAVVMPSAGTPEDLRAEGSFGLDIPIKIFSKNFEVLDLDGNVVMAPNSIDANEAKIEIKTLGHTIAEYSDSAKEQLSKSINFAIIPLFGGSASKSIGWWKFRVSVKASAGGLLFMHGKAGIDDSGLYISGGPKLSVGASASGGVSIGVGSASAGGDVDLVSDSLSVSQKLSPTLNFSEKKVSAKIGQKVTNNIKGPNGRLYIKGKVGYSIFSVSKSFTIASFSTYSRNDTLYSTSKTIADVDF